MRSIAELDARLRGKWLYCASDEVAHQGIEILPGGHWFYLDRGRRGELVRQKGFDGGGRWRTQDNTSVNERFHAQLDLETTQGIFQGSATFQRAPDRIRLEGNERVVTLVPAPGYRLAPQQSPPAPSAPVTEPLERRELACESLEPHLVDGLVAVPAVDYVSYRYEHVGAELARGTDAERGTPCGRARSKATCLAALAQTRVARGTAEHCSAAQREPGTAPDPTCDVGYYLYTRGDRIGVARTKAEIAALIGTIDTREEAEWVLSQHANVGCVGSYSRTPAEHTFRYVTNCDGGNAPASIRTATIDLAGHVTETSVPARNAARYPCALQ